MIDGLKLTVTGEELRKLLDERIDEHEERAERWKREAARTKQDEEHPLLPEHICENEAERHEWRIEVLEFIRDHLDPSEVYLLGRDDLELGELLPDKPGWMEQDEYERETGVAFNLKRLTKELGQLASGAFALASARATDTQREEEEQRYAEGAVQEGRY